MQGKQARLSADDSQLKRVGQTAQSIVDNMIRSSRQYTTSSKEALRDIEEQIRSIEKRNKIDLDGKKAIIDAEKRSLAEFRNRQMYEARAISDPKQRSSAIREVSASYSAQKDTFSQREGVFRAEAEERKKQTQALREIVDEIKNTSKNEIKSNREFVEKTIKRDKSLDKLGVSGDSELSLKRSIQRDMLGELGREEFDERSNFRKYARRGSSAFNTGAGVMTSKNDLYALAAVVGLSPWVGQGASDLAQRTLSAGETAENSIVGYSRATFGNYQKSSANWELAKEEGLSSIGLDPSEVLNRRTTLKRIGTSAGASTFRQLMGAEQFVGADSINQIASVNRYGGGDMSQVLQALEGGQRNITRLTENVSAYVMASNNTLQMSSNINESQMAKTIMGISAATGQQGTGLNQTVSAIQGMGQTSNPVVKSLMMRAFRKANPNASLFQLQAMMEDPLKNFSQGGSQFLGNIKKMSGGGDMYKQVLYAVFGGKLSKSRIEEIVQGGNLSKIQSEINNAGGEIDFLKEAEGGAGIATRLTAETDAAFQEWGKNLIKVGGETVETLKTLLGGLIDGEEKKSKKDAEYQREQLKKLTDLERALGQIEKNTK